MGLGNTIFFMLSFLLELAKNVFLPSWEVTAFKKGLFVAEMELKLLAGGAW